MNRNSCDQQPSCNATCRARWSCLFTNVDVDAFHACVNGATAGGSNTKSAAIIIAAVLSVIIVVAVVGGGGYLVRRTVTQRKPQYAVVHSAEEIELDNLITETADDEYMI